VKWELWDARRGMRWLAVALFVGFNLQTVALGEAYFAEGRDAYAVGNYQKAAQFLQQAAAEKPTSGTLQNLGNSEWQAGHPGSAILAWEQTLWVDPFNHAARGNLLFVRKAAQIESPELMWYEVASAWLPANWWAWLTAVSFWTAVAVVTLPAIFRWRKAGWQQAIAALCLTLFLLSVPAQIGICTRTDLGFILQRETPFRLTPTVQAQVLARLPAGEPARCLKRRGDDVLVRTSRGLGWVRSDQFGLICH
jgi:hypothetical protein